MRHPAPFLAGKKPGRKAGKSWAKPEKTLTKNTETYINVRV